MGDTALGTLGTVVTYILGEFTDMAATLLDTPLALIGLGFFVIGGTIGLVHRIVR